MIKFEVIGYASNGTYAEMVDASNKDEALKLGKRSMKT